MLVVCSLMDRLVKKIITGAAAMGSEGVFGMLILFIRMQSRLLGIY